MLYFALYIFLSHFSFEGSFFSFFLPLSFRHTTKDVCFDSQCFSGLMSQDVSFSELLVMLAVLSRENSKPVTKTSCCDMSVAPAPELQNTG